MDNLIALAWLGLALVTGKLLRRWIPVLTSMFIPASILGGFVLLIAGPEIIGRIFSGNLTVISPSIVGIWSGYPGFLINIVFATLFLGKKLPSIREIWRKAGPQVAFGHTVAWGQYVVGFLVTAFLLVPLFKVEPMFGALIEIGFIGGHGTAAGLGETFKELGWPQGKDLALGVATIGVVVGVLSGILLVNWGVRKGHARWLSGKKEEDSSREHAASEHDSLEADLVMEDSGASTENERGKPAIGGMEPLSFHLAYIALAIGAGAIILRVLSTFEEMFLVPAGVPVLLGHVPLFPLTMIGGIVVEKIHHRFFDASLDRELILRIQGTALDLLIVSALASLTLSTLAQAWLPLLILVFCGIAWTVTAFLFFAPRMIKDYWFERGIGDFGQSLGVTATGLLLMRIVDPGSKTPAFESFAYKQLLFEPFVGGGLFTAVSVPLVYTFGLWPMLAVTSFILLFWISLGLLMGRKNRK